MLVLVALLSPSAQAQVFDRPYQAYLANLQAVADLAPPTSTPYARLFEGMVSIRAPLPGTAVIGRSALWEDGGLYTNDTVFLRADLDPGAEYRLLHEGDLVEATLMQDLYVNYGGNWPNEPCYRRSFVYHAAPEGELAQNLTLDEDIDRYFFVVWQKLPNVDAHFGGFMLREHHHRPNQPEVFYEHWAFHENFQDFEEGVELRLVEATEQLPHTTAFFEAVFDEAPAEDWRDFAQLSFEPGLDGWQCY